MEILRRHMQSAIQQLFRLIELTKFKVREAGQRDRNGMIRCDSEHFFAVLQCTSRIT
jgi:hypothetical protein